MIDSRFCSQIGTARQHGFACYLASRAGYERLRDAASDFFGCSVSKMGRKVVTVKDASEFIDWLKAKG